jgi:hypothetical protein
VSIRLEGVLSLCADGGVFAAAGVDATRSMLLFGVEDVRWSLCKTFDFGAGVAAAGDSLAFFACMAASRRCLSASRALFCPALAIVFFITGRPLGRIFAFLAGSSSSTVAGSSSIRDGSSTTFFVGGLPLPRFLGGITSSMLSIVEVGMVGGELTSRGAFDATLVLLGRGI